MIATLEIDAYITDFLMPHLVGKERKPSSFLLYLALTSQMDTLGRVEASHKQMAQMTGLSKRAAQMASYHLEEIGLIEVSRNSPTGIAQISVCAPWRK